MQDLRVIRDVIVATELSIRMPLTDFTSRRPGWTRLEAARAILEDAGLEVSERIVMQVIPIGQDIEIRLTDAR